MNRKEIPENISAFVKYDESSSSGLRWIKKICDKINIGDEAGRLKING